MRGEQRYKCKNCGYVFQNKDHTNKKKTQIQNKQLWEDYSIHKQTYKELSKTYSLSVRTVQKRLDAYILPIPIFVPTSIILLIDTTYFGDVGVMAFKDSYAYTLGICNVNLIPQQYILGQVGIVE